MIDMSLLKSVDIDVFDAMNNELKRQRRNIELIASENIVSPAVMAACGSHLTNKYAEGLPGKRYYGGCEYVDVVEQLAIDRAKALFGADHANVQPHSGANANMAVYFALLKPGDTILGMNLAHGGHLTHGSPVNISGKYFKIVPYGVSKETKTIDYEELERIAIECKPQIIVAGASAYSRTIDFARFSEIAKKVGAYLMVDMAHIAGLVATGQHPNPVPYADVVTTTTHKTLRGPRGGLILCKEALAKAIDKAVFPGIQGGPLENIIAGKAIALKEAMSEEFITYQKQVVTNARVLSEELINLGIAIVSGGTDNHLILIDLTPKSLTGKVVEALLDKAHITANKNGIPFDTQTPFVTSGVRIGTPAVTSRGMKEEEMKLIAKYIVDIIDNGEVAVERVGKCIAELCEKFPIYTNDII